MSNLFEIARALDVVRAQQNALTERRQEIEREARTTSKRTQARARHLMTDALLALLQNSETVTPQALKHQIDRQASDRDRFAVKLCEDWLGATEK